MSFARKDLKPSEDGSSSLGERLRKIRGQTSMEAFAATIGVHRNTVLRYEQGDGFPPADVLSKICKLFQINANWLLIGKGPWRATLTDYSFGDQIQMFDDEESKYSYFVPITNRPLGLMRFPPVALNVEWINKYRKVLGRPMVIVMPDDAMEPTIRKGDITIIEWVDVMEQAIPPGLYLVSLRTGMTIRRVESLSEHQLRITCDNAKYVAVDLQDPGNTLCNGPVIGRLSML